MLTLHIDAIYNVLKPIISLELEWKLSEKGVIKTDLEENPFKKREIRDVMTISVRGNYKDPEDSDDD